MAVRVLPAVNLKYERGWSPVTERKATKGTSLLALFFALGQGTLDLKGDASRCMDVKVAEYVFRLTGHLAVSTAPDMLPLE